MAVSLAFGVLFSTLITLLIVPTSYLILEDLARGWRWLVGSEGGVRKELEVGALQVR
jgi:hypothetical protein